MKYLLFTMCTLCTLSLANERAVVLRCQEYMQKPVTERAFDCGFEYGFMYLRTRVKRPKPADEIVYLQLKENWILSSVTSGYQLRVIESSVLFKAERVAYLYNGRIVNLDFDGPDAKAFWKKVDRK